MNETNQMNLSQSDDDINNISSEVALRYARLFDDIAITAKDYIEECDDFCKIYIAALGYQYCTKIIYEAENIKKNLKAFEFECQNTSSTIRAYIKSNSDWGNFAQEEHVINFLIEEDMEIVEKYLNEAAEFVDKSLDDLDRIFGLKE